MRLHVHARDQKLPFGIPAENSIYPIDFQQKINSVDKKENFVQTMITDKGSTLYIRVKGAGPGFPGISDGDLLVVERRTEPKHNNLVVAVMNGEFILKRIGIHQNKMFLLSESSQKPLEITETMDFTLWGVVNFIIHRV
ncbi:MAG: LexA family protein [Cytophagaceae bacterium]